MVPIDRQRNAALIEARRPKAPLGSSEEARRLWVSILDEYQIDDGAGLLVLRTALEALDRMRAALAELKRDGCSIRDRWGQLKAHPAAMVERDSRTGMLAALKALGLDPKQVAG